MKVLIGLGNPGLEYAMTRHNAGFMVIDRLAHAHAGGQVVKARFQSAALDATIHGEKVLLLKPTTYMNRSGQAVAEAIRFYKLQPASDVLVIVDDLYLPTGSLRVKPSGGTGGHNGLASIQQLLGTEEYPRLRIGVGEQPSGGKPPQMDQADYVLSRFREEEKPLLDQALRRSVEACEVFATKGLTAAMNAANGEEKPAGTKARRHEADEEERR